MTALLVKRIKRRGNTKVRAKGMYVTEAIVQEMDNKIFFLKRSTLYSNCFPPPCVASQLVHGNLMYL